MYMYDIQKCASMLYKNNVQAELIKKKPVRTCINFKRAVHTYIYTDMSM